MIILVRHGRTEANAQGLLLGRLDPALDGEGRRQATCVADCLRDAPIRRVVSSPLGRCRSTAAAVAAAVGVEVDLDERWIELHYGALDGLRVGDVPTSLWARWRADVTWAPEGGESLAGLGERVRSACNALLDDAALGDVVVVSHVSPIKAAVAWALGVGDDVAWRMWLAPASITRIGVVGGRPSLRSFNELAHLG